MTSLLTVLLACSSPPPSALPEAASPPDPPLSAATAAQVAEEQIPGRTTEPWNVVVITADTLRADLLPMNGGAEVRTPTLSALQAEGVNFRRAYTTFTTTLPAHTGIFASLYARDHGVYNNMGRLGDEVETLAERLAAAGYHTAAHINLPWLNPEASNLAQGFAEVRRADTIRKADETGRWAVDFLARQDAQPFFLWLHYIDNHSPYYAPGAHERAYFSGGPRAAGQTPLSAIWDVLPAGHRNNRHFQRWVRGVRSADYLVGTYKGSISWLDSQLGAVIASLKESGQWERTLLVFTADHGESLGEHGLWFVHEGLYEPTVRVPLLVRVPGGPAGVQVDAVVSTVSVAPTVLAAVGAPPLPAARGDDLWPLMSGLEDGAGRMAFFEHLEGRLEGGVTAQHKLIVHLKDDDTFRDYPLRQGTTELFDLASDPGERHDLAAEQPALTSRLAEQLATLKPHRAAAEAEAQQLSDQTREALQALGYLDEELPLLSQAPLRHDASRLE